MPAPADSRKRKNPPMPSSVGPEKSVLLKILPEKLISRPPPITFSTFFNKVICNRLVNKPRETPGTKPGSMVTEQIEP